MELSEIYLRFTFDLTNTEPGAHLHWGLWQDIAHDFRHLPEAQEQYAERVRSLLPDGSVVDVGCGLGGIAKTLDQVRCITPLPEQAQKVRSLGLEVECTRFQDWRGKADVLLFAESFGFFLGELPQHLERCRRAASHIVVADLIPDSLWPDLESELEIEELHDVTEVARFTTTALQQRFEQVLPWDRLMRDTLRAMDSSLADQVNQTLANVPNSALQSLLDGRMVEDDLLVGKRYLMFRAKL